MSIVFGRIPVDVGVDDTTNDSTTTGSLQTDGGLGVGNLYLLVRLSQRENNSKFGDVDERHNNYSHRVKSGGGKVVTLPNWIRW